MTEPPIDDPYAGDDDVVNPESMKLLVTDNRGQFVLDLPEGWRVTFAAVNPAGQTMSRDLHCLRVWDGPGKAAHLRAVFCDVRGFRDLNIPFARKVEKETGSATWNRDDLGNYESTVSRKMLEPQILEGDEAF